MPLQNSQPEFTELDWLGTLNFLFETGCGRTYRADAIGHVFDLEIHPLDLEQSAQ